jgi:hypothetical protein
MNKDKTQLLLEQLLSEIHKEQAKETSSTGKSYLISQDKQLLGKFTSKFDSESIFNKYGPYGSKYSPTSIFNKYSQYGSKYGAYSINNPYCTVPPRLVINDEFAGYISVNKNLKHQIPTETFLYLLENDPNSLLAGKFSLKESDIRSKKGESFIVANDGQYLGKLTTNTFDSDSILNEFGPYGNEYSPTSIFNEYSTYGSEFSSDSPFNEYSTTPPKIFVDGSFYGYLTENKHLSGKRIDPKGIKEWVLANFS